MSRVSRRRYGGGSIETATFFQQPPQEAGFRVLFAAPEPGAGPAARAVLDRLADRGLDVVTTQSRASLQSTIAGGAAGDGGWPDGPADAGAPGREPAPPACAGPIGAAVLSRELFGSPGELASAIDDIQRLGAPPPVVVVSELDPEQAVPPGLAGRAAASFWLPADSPHFVADQVEWLVRTYALRSRVIGALTVAPEPQLRAGH